MRAHEAMPGLDSLRMFDGCLTLGRLVHSAYSPGLTVDQALELMDRYHIAEALVHEHDARLIHPRERANRRAAQGRRKGSRACTRSGSSSRPNRPARTRPARWWRRCSMPVSAPPGCR